MSCKLIKFSFTQRFPTTTQTNINLNFVTLDIRERYFLFTRHNLSENKRSPSLSRSSFIKFDAQRGQKIINNHNEPANLKEYLFLAVGIINLRNDDLEAVLFLL